MKYIDLFGGIGGFSYGIEQATKGKWECVWYCDNDKYAVQTYNKNYGENYEATDITTVKTTDIPDHDCICGGFPCQTFSIAGKRRGFEDIRGTMFFEIMRIAKAKRTKYLFLENVKGLLNHNKGKTFTSTADFSEFPRTEKGCSLSQVLEEQVDQKYYLSEKMQKRFQDYLKDKNNGR